MKKGYYALVILLLGCGGCSPDSLNNVIDMGGGFGPGGGGRPGGW